VFAELYKTNSAEAFKMQQRFYGTVLLTFLLVSCCLSMDPEGQIGVRPFGQPSQPASAPVGEAPGPVPAAAQGEHIVVDGQLQEAHQEQAPASVAQVPHSSEIPPDFLALAERMQIFLDRQDQDRLRAAAAPPLPPLDREDNSAALNVLRGFENLFNRAAGLGAHLPEQGSAAAPPPFGAPPPQLVPPPPPPPAIPAGSHIPHGPAVGMQDLGAFLAGILNPRQQLQQGQLLGAPLGGAPPLATDLPGVQVPFWAHLYGPSLAQFQHRSLRGIGPEQIRMPLLIFLSAASQLGNPSS
jgi:hypothetical protein